VWPLDVAGCSLTAPQENRGIKPKHNNKLINVQV
jgi:hypothetical protein